MKLTEKEVLYCKILHLVYEHGISYNTMDKILAILKPDIEKTKTMENELIKKFEVDYFWHLTTKCPNCQSFQRGIATFCSTCLKKEKRKITPRLKGCRNDCFANPKMCCEENYNGIDLEKENCTHDRNRVRGINPYHSLTPITQVIDLTNSKMIDCIIGSTEEEIVDHITKCKDNDSFSPIAGHNNLYGFKAFGKDDVVQALVNYHKDFESLENDSNDLEVGDSFRKLVECIAAENSIERMYLHSM